MPTLQLTRERFGKRAFSVSSAAEHLKRATDAGDLRKCLGLAELTFLGTGSIIGAGGLRTLAALAGAGLLQACGLALAEVAGLRLQGTACDVLQPGLQVPDDAGVFVLSGVAANESAG